MTAVKVVPHAILQLFGISVAGESNTGAFGFLYQSLQFRISS
jgi:hypothetical protein